MRTEYIFMTFMLRCLLFLICFDFHDVCRSFFVMTSFSFRRSETPLVKQSWICYLWLTSECRKSQVGVTTFQLRLFYVNFIDWLRMYPAGSARPTIYTVSPSVHDLEEHPAKSNTHFCIGQSSVYKVVAIFIVRVT